MSQSPDGHGFGWGWGGAEVARRWVRGAAGGNVDQNWAKTLPSEAGWSQCGVEIGEAKRKFRLDRRAAKEPHTSPLEIRSNVSLQVCERGSPAGRASRHSEDLKIGADLIACRRPISR